MSYEITISKEYEGTRVKNYLKKFLDLPHSALFKFLKNKRITLNGKKIKKDDVLHQGDIIKVWLDSISLRKVQTSFAESKDLDMDILENNDDFLVLNKLPEVIVQGAQDNSKSLSLHLRYLKKKFDDSSDFEYFHVHRLDKDTSGVLVIAKKRPVLRELNSLFRNRDVVKKYLCLCDGEFLEKNGTVELYLCRAPDGSREKVYVSQQQNKDSKVTLSHYRVLKEYSHKDNILSLVEVEIKTGFMHQIRAHMKHVGHPIIGDKMYGNSYINSFYEAFLKRQFLHASSIEFSYNSQNYFIESPLTKDLDKFLKFISS